MESYEALIAKATPALYRGGVLLLAGKQECNPITIGWCQFGRLWNRPMVTAFIRPSRYSHGLIERDGIFTIACPQDDAMKKALVFCGTNSGRDVDKLQALQLTRLPSRAGGVDSLQGRFVHFECKVAGKAEFAGNLALLDEATRLQFYNPEKEAGDSGDMHTVYFADVLAAYETE